MTWLFAVNRAAPVPIFETLIVQVQVFPTEVVPPAEFALVAVRSGTVTVKLSLVTAVRPELDAVNVNDPACVGIRLEKVAKPFDAATEVVPVRVPPPLIVTMAVLAV